jgi:thiamine pyrophosphate-dependent acetolactate synthase large subunit-like protein
MKAAALDSTDVKAILCLFEGVVTGAADGYAGMADKPASTSSGLSGIIGIFAPG